MTLYLLAGAAALLLAMAVASRLARRRRVRTAAGNIRSTMQALYSGPHSYREVSLRDFPGLDHAFYEEKTGELAALDFSFLGDLEDVTVNQAQIGEPTAIRVMLSDDRKVLACFYHAEVAGKSARIVDLESVLADETFVVTSTARAAAPLSMPPEVDCEFHPGGGSLGALVQAHRRRVRARAAAPGAPAVLEIGSLAEVIEHQRSMDMAKTRFRKGQATLMSRDELQRLGGPERFHTASAVADEMERDARRR
jgi:hypothetical protein